MRAQSQSLKTPSSSRDIGTREESRNIEILGDDRDSKLDSQIEFYPDEFYYSSNDEIDLDDEPPSLSNSQPCSSTAPSASRNNFYLPSASTPSSQSDSEYLRAGESVLEQDLERDRRDPTMRVLNNWDLWNGNE